MSPPGRVTLQALALDEAERQVAIDLLLAYSGDPPVWPDVPLDCILAEYMADLFHLYSADPGVIPPTKAREDTLCSLAVKLGRALHEQRKAAGK